MTSQIGFKKESVFGVTPSATGVRLRPLKLSKLPRVDKHLLEMSSARPEFKSFGRFMAEYVSIVLGFVLVLCLVYSVDYDTTTEMKFESELSNNSIELLQISKDSK